MTSGVRPRAPRPGLDSARVPVVCAKGWLRPYAPTACAGTIAGAIAGVAMDSSPLVFALVGLCGLGSMVSTVAANALPPQRSQLAGGRDQVHRRALEFRRLRRHAPGSALGLQRERQPCPRAPLSSAKPSGFRSRRPGASKAPRGQAVSALADLGCAIGLVAVIVLAVVMVLTGHA